MKMKKRINERLYGAILGDYCGSAYEFGNNKDYNCQLFTKQSDYTDDTILTVATADAILNGKDFAETYKEWGRAYPNPKGGYGGMFSMWLHSDNLVGYNSLGNGSAMRVSPCAYVSQDWNEIIDCASKSALATHSHWEGIRAAQAVARCIYLIDTDYVSREDIASVIRAEFDYRIPPVKADYEMIQATYSYSERAVETVPLAIWCALSAESFEDSIRRAVALGGDADTLGAITGSIAECLYRIPLRWKIFIEGILPDKMKQIIKEFNQKFVL